MTPLMILIESRIDELIQLVRRAKEDKLGIRRVRALQSSLNHNKQILNIMQRRYYEEAETVHTEKEYLS